MIEIPPLRLQRIQAGKEMLTTEEMRDGWHWSDEWDGLVIHKTHPEAAACGCPVCKGACECEKCKGEA